MGPIGKAEGLADEELKSRLQVASSLVPYLVSYIGRAHYVATHNTLY
ncbi:hypothetical protein DSCO28_14630 [Desulfosarcina ovata subsp. sediminis]|uniref:Uncharacterized protein n=1 Tax=Desulfosarcina ovata subsp. sediminis TaxID=885957 RepID=A0A5K7ZLJ8_9BACT|nr:hypothetical protein DSCO28_14630 [Desulfosarcina ovata subsp. sediminis]